ncbi:MAG: phosphoribosylaminoimidazolesuccinocarboxamide synthase [Longimicrobiales bacterium]|nr:phosphoribosylaminoimidazolesuccinocarboxamide synthase [Longimicrobiales bacterium]
MTTHPIRETDLPLPLLRRGKVRDIYEAGPDALLMVASDRVSAFDCVLPQPIPHKGEVLTLITAWWLTRLDAAEPHHLLSVDPTEIAGQLPILEAIPERWARRSMLVRRTEPIPVECVVRGYLAGSAWREYRDRGTLAGEPLPEGLQQSSPLPSPLFSPATKAEEGHDENITFDEVEERLGPELAGELRERSLRLYTEGAAMAAGKGVLLADTKFEFGRLSDGRVLLIDEVMTPDSSRYWPEEDYAEGGSQPSLDKQPIRDWLDALEDWDKSPPPPDLTPEVVRAASERYRKIFHRLTGSELEEWPLPSFEWNPESFDFGLEDG